MVGQLSGVTTMKARLTVNAKLDKSRFPINVEATAEEMVSVNLGSHELYGGNGPMPSSRAGVSYAPAGRSPWALSAVRFPPIFSHLIG